MLDRAHDTCRPRQARGAERRHGTSCGWGAIFIDGRPSTGSLKSRRWGAILRCSPCSHRRDINLAPSIYPFPLAFFQACAPRVPEMSPRFFLSLSLFLFFSFFFGFVGPLLLRQGLSRNAITIPGVAEYVTRARFRTPVLLHP